MSEPRPSAGEIAAHLGRLWKFQVREIDEWVRSGGGSPRAPDQKDDS